ncbi:hypothetical protein PIB30_090187 [Stylosanthes scabra]|uniref:Uncharacterized protein n=1 Tax=Stylosanthes scabra TaxID=79078 RepID=A0ABU6SVN3_9FABA|nr:hypothetical protein [Stylosanthes scabra]
MEKVERKAKVQAAELESCRSTLAQEVKKGSRRHWTRPRPPRFTGAMTGSRWGRRLEK